MTKQVDYTTPVAQPSVEGSKLVAAHIDFVTGKVSLTCQVVDGLGNVVGGNACEYASAQATLDSIATTLLQEAQTAGEVPAGPVVDG